jgi:hypothetical protein
MLGYTAPETQTCTRAISRARFHCKGLRCASSAAALRFPHAAAKAICFWYLRVFFTGPERVGAHRAFHTYSIARLHSTQKDAREKNLEASFAP